MTRLRSPDDFTTIRARMEELRRERVQILAKQEGGRGKEACRNETR